MSDFGDFGTGFMIGLMSAGTPSINSGRLHSSSHNCNCNKGYAPIDLQMTLNSYFDITHYQRSPILEMIANLGYEPNKPTEEQPK